MEISSTCEENTQEVISRGPSKEVNPAAQIPSYGILQHIQCLEQQGTVEGQNKSCCAHLKIDSFHNHAFIKFPELEGTHKEHQNATPGPAQVTPGIPVHKT